MFAHIFGPWQPCAFFGEKRLMQEHAEHTEHPIEVRKVFVWLDFASVKLSSVSRV